MPTQPSAMLTHLNSALTYFGCPPAGSLMHTMYATNGTVRCMEFAGRLLELVAGTWDVPSYSGQNFPTNATQAGSFYYFCLMGDPSGFNHAFCVYFWQTDALLIQTYVNQPVRLLQRLSRVDLLDGLVDLRRLHGPQFEHAYQRLFGVPAVGYQVKEIQVAPVL